MAVVSFVEFPNATIKQYDQVMKEMDMGKATPPGALCHIAYEENGRLRVVNVWESEEDGDRFMREKLIPVWDKLGMGRPHIRTYRVHNTLGLPEHAKRK